MKRGVVVKYLLIVLMIIVIAWLISSCDVLSELRNEEQNENSSGIMTEDTTPTSIPEDGIWVHFKIYTIDDITPNGNIKLVVYSPSGGSSEIILEQANSNISGVSLYSGWVRFDNINETDCNNKYRLSFYNSNGKRALGLYMEDYPYWRAICKYKDNLWKIDEEKKQYEYREIIRHWEDSPPPNKQYVIKARAIDEERNSINGFKADLAVTHQVGDGGFWGHIIYSPVFATLSELSYTADKIRTINNEYQLPFIDSVEVWLKKDFYAYSWAQILYSELEHNSDFGELTFYANRMTLFEWIISDDGRFNGNEETMSGTINMISDYDFTNEDLAKAFLKYFNDKRLVKLNEYDFDEDGQADFKCFWDKNRKAIYLEGFYGIADIGEGDIEDERDIASYLYTHVVNEMLNHLYAVKTSSGKYVLLKVLNLHKMTKEEMNPDLYLNAGMEEATVVTSDSTPSDVPEDGIWVYFKIYTIDEITPPGNIRMKISFPDGKRYAFTDLTKGNSNIPGVSLYTKWVRFDNINETSWDNTYYYDFYNSDNKKALGLYMINHPFWRNLNSACLYDALKVIDGDKKQFEYYELIRHWEDSPFPNRTYAINVKFLNEDGNPIKVRYTLEVWHEPRRDSRWGMSIYHAEDVSESNFIANKIRLIEHEDMLPLRDGFLIWGMKDFYVENGDWDMLYYKTLKETNDLQLTLYINRMIGFRWVMSDDGKFNGSEATIEGTINTVANYDFVHREVAEKFLESFNDPRLLYLDAYDFDEDGKIDIRADWWNRERKKVFCSVNGEIVDIGDVGLSSILDLTGYSYTPSCISVEKSHVYAVKTSNDKYVKFKVIDIHKMRESETQKWLGFVDSSTQDISNSINVNKISNVVIINK